ncbi:MAG: methionyl-tRNA synthetase [Gaiellaceae bacterium]|nr:methionyl-tRNA synthetase [Gaiellaceae bacterium]
MTSGPWWITATPPTPNGDLHVGHMAGPYLAADVLRRFLRADGHAVVLTTGMDDHQSYVHAQGLRSGDDAAAVAREFGDRICTAWLSAEIEFDRVVVPPADPRYVPFVQRFFQTLYDAGALVARDRPLPYCEVCDRWLYEAYVVGGCPHCGADSNGNACELCGRPNECGDLVDPRCTLCDTPATLRSCERLFFPLAAYADRLEAYWETVAMPPHLHALCETMLADGLPEVAVSHPSGWGVPVPVRGFEEQRIYVWLEMAPGYMLEYDGSGAGPGRGPVQFFGFDNGYFHAILFPALFMAVDPKIPLATSFIMNEFYLLEGKKFSTSRRHAVWAIDALRDAGSDALRFHVLADRPVGRETNFEADDLQIARQYLRTRWNGWLERLSAAVRSECDGAAPIERPRGSDWDLLAARLRHTAAELRDAYSEEGFDTRRAVSLLDETVRLAEDYGYVHAHRRSGPSGASEYRAALTAQLAVASALAAWAAPILPEGAGRLAAMLGVAPTRPITADALVAPEAGTRLSEPDGAIFGA